MSNVACFYRAGEGVPHISLEREAIFQLEPSLCFPDKVRAVRRRLNFPHNWKFGGAFFYHRGKQFLADRKTVSQVPVNRQENFSLLERI